MFESHWGCVYRECCRILRNPAQAEDAAAETFLRACRAFADYDDLNPLGWLLTIARRVCINLIRRASTGLEVNVEDLPEYGSAEISLDVVLLLQELPGMIRSLQDDRRVALRLYLHGYSYARIAAFMGCEEKQVRTHLQTAFRQLRRLWESGQLPKGGGQSSE